MILFSHIFVLFSYYSLTFFNYSCALTLFLCFSLCCVTTSVRVKKVPAQNDSHKIRSSHYIFLKCWLDSVNQKHPNIHQFNRSSGRQTPGQKYSSILNPPIKNWELYLKNNVYVLPDERFTFFRNMESCFREISCLLAQFYLFLIFLWMYVVQYV